MTPKEKAIELWNKFLLYAETEIPPEAANNVRQCCIMCVDEIINCKHGWNKSTSKFVEYWNQVKEEITKL